MVHIVNFKNGVYISNVAEALLCINWGKLTYFDASFSLNTNYGGSFTITGYTGQQYPYGVQQPGYPQYPVGTGNTSSPMAASTDNLAQPPPSYEQLNTQKSWILCWNDFFYLVFHVI